MRVFVRWIFWLSWLAVLLVQAENELFFNHEASQKLIEKKPIHLEAEGIAQIRFEDAANILGRDDMLDAIQRGYEQTLPDGEEPEFRVHQTGPGTYQFINKHQQQTDIEEVERVDLDGERVIISLYTQGRRFFGPFESLCRVEVWPHDAESVGYRVQVYARPESATIRFLARFSPVEIFFRHKTKQLTGLVVDVCEEILKEDANTYAVEKAKPLNQKDEGT